MHLLCGVCFVYVDKCITVSGIQNRHNTDANVSGVARVLQIYVCVSSYLCLQYCTKP